jgi:trehalose 6-phosphate phosphatase
VGVATKLLDAIQSLVARVPPERLLVATDFDGTLARIVQHPLDARPLPGAPEALRRLRDSVLRVAIITGRSEAMLREVLPLNGILVLGDYGRPDPTELELRALDEFNRNATDLIAHRPGIRLEAKPGSTSIHYRDRPASGAGLFEEVRPLAERFGLDVRRGRMVVEVLPGGWDKSRALERLIEVERAGGAIYCGDDEGDRRCFELLAASELPHLAVGVRSEEAAPDLFEACDLVVNGPEEAVAFLNRLAGEIDRRRGRDRAGPGSEGSASG